MKYVYIKTPTPVMRAHKLLDSHPISSFALFKIHEIIESKIPGSDANALSANLPSSCDRAFNLFFYPFPRSTTFPSVTAGTT